MSYGADRATMEVACSFAEQYYQNFSVSGITVLPQYAPDARLVTGGGCNPLTSQTLSGRDEIADYFEHLDRVLGRRKIALTSIDAVLGPGRTIVVTTSGKFLTQFCDWQFTQTFVLTAGATTPTTLWITTEATRFVETVDHRRIARQQQQQQQRERELREQREREVPMSQPAQQQQPPQQQQQIVPTKIEQKPPIAVPQPRHQQEAAKAINNKVFEEPDDDERRNTPPPQKFEKRARDNKRDEKPPRRDEKPAREEKPRRDEKPVRREEKRDEKPAPVREEKPQKLTAADVARNAGKKPVTPVPKPEEKKDTKPRRWADEEFDGADTRQVPGKRQEAKKEAPAKEPKKFEKKKEEKKPEAPVAAPASDAARHRAILFDIPQEASLDDVDYYCEPFGKIVTSDWVGRAKKHAWVEFKTKAQLRAFLDYGEKFTMFKKPVKTDVFEERPPRQ